VRHRVSDVSRELLRQGVRAVLATLREALPQDEIDDLMSQLPNDIRALFLPTGPGSLVHLR
jgi:uncharacterized protein (DUF2267 family)